jgi:hypothetical protein
VEVDGRQDVAEPKKTDEKNTALVTKNGDNANRVDENKSGSWWTTFAI